MKALKIAAGAALIASAPLAFAATDTGQLNVAATVTGSCTVTDATLSFGSVNLVDATADTTTTTIDVTCSPTVTYDIGLSAGTTTGATTADRMMSDGATNTLKYSLTDAISGTNWGDVVGTDTVAATGTGAAQTYTINGAITAGQSSVPAGSYTDTVTITVTY